MYQTKPVGRRASILIAVGNWFARLQFVDLVHTVLLFTKRKSRNKPAKLSQ